MAWTCVARFLSERQMVRQLLPLCRSAQRAAEDELQQRWPWDQSRSGGRCAAALWRRLLSQPVRRRCMVCGGDRDLDVRMVCPCSAHWWDGCLQYHRRCCRLRRAHHPMLTLARCGLCGEWSMALCAAGVRSRHPSSSQSMRRRVRSSCALGAFGSI